MKEIDKAIKYYKSRKREFKSLYSGKYIVIVSNAVVGVYDTHAEAYTDAKNQYEVGTFLIEHPLSSRERI